MDKDEVTRWALANGWQTVGDMPSLMKPPAFRDPIVRIVLKATMANVEFKKPSGKWDKVASEAYKKIVADPDGGAPSGLGIDTIAGLSALMSANKDWFTFNKKP